MDYLSHGPFSTLTPVPWSIYPTLIHTCIPHLNKWTIYPTLTHGSFTHGPFTPTLTHGPFTHPWTIYPMVHLPHFNTWPIGPFTPTGQFTPWSIYPTLTLGNSFGFCILSQWFVSSGHKNTLSFGGSVPWSEGNTCTRFSQSVSKRVGAPNVPHPPRCNGKLSI